MRATPSVEAVVSITSDKAYRNDEWVWGYRETDHLGGYDPYSASKGCAEIIAHSYFKSFFGDPVNAPYCATTRAGNIIGGGDWAADRIVPDCARVERGQGSGNPQPARHPSVAACARALSGYLWLGAKLFAAHRDAVKAGKGDGCHEGFRLDGEAFNFGPSSDASHTVADVVQSLESQWSGFGSKMDLAGQAGMKECTLLKLCCGWRALACLNWRATLDFDTTMRFTAKWYEVFYREQGADIYAFTQSQIQDYCRKAAASGLPWSSRWNPLLTTRGNARSGRRPHGRRPGHAYDAPGLPAVRGDGGKLYFSEVDPGCVKAWKCHTRQTQRFAVPVGQLKIVLYDDRPESPTRGRIMEVLLGRPDNYALLQIPPRVWYGFAAAGSVPAVICNCPDIPHDPAEGLRRDVDSRDIPYHW